MCGLDSCSRDLDFKKIDSLKPRKFEVFGSDSRPFGFDLNRMYLENSRSYRLHFLYRSNMLNFENSRQIV